MRTRLETIEAHAAECRRRAASTTDRFVKNLFLDIAETWTELAGTIASLEADKRETERFWSPIADSVKVRGVGKGVPD